MSFMIINSEQESSYLLPFEKESTGKRGQVKAVLEFFGREHHYSKEQPPTPTCAERYEKN